MSTLDTERGGITRREALKRGALVGGAVAWSIPAIQLIAMTSAHAERPSGSTPPAKPPGQVLGEKTTSSGGKLPFTGSDVGGMAAVGTGALAVGAGLTATAIYGARRAMRSDEPEAQPPAR